MNIKHLYYEDEEKENQKKKTQSSIRPHYILGGNSDLPFLFCWRTCFYLLGHWVLVYP